MVRDQMLCIVTPLGDVSPQTVAARLADAARRQRLHTLLAAHGGLHYATFTLLPASPAGAPSPSGPALALGLALDADLSPHDALERLVALGQPILGELYAEIVDTTDARSLLAALEHRDHLHPATGGFVGARDRSVAQIRAEGALLAHLRRTVLPGALRAVGGPAQTDARTLAAEISERVLADPDFAWAARQAARSRWRGTVTPGPRRFAATAGHGVLLAFAVVVLATLALGGFACDLVVALVDPYFIGLHDGSAFKAVWTAGGGLGVGLRGLALALVLLAVTSALIARLQGLRALALELGLILSALVFLALAVAPLVLLAFKDAAAVRGELGVAVRHIATGFVVFAAFAGVALLLAGATITGLVLTPPWSSRARLVATTAACVAVGAVVVHLSLVGVLHVGKGFGWKAAAALLESGGRPWYFGLIVDRVAVTVVVVAAALAGLLYAASRALASAWVSILTPLNAPRPARAGPQYRRLHQTAASIDACDAGLVGRTACMISLTEIRRPYFFHANLARFFLWLISSLGWHVYSEGRLGTVSSIQFAQWNVIDRGRRLLFCAHFDGDFGGYLDEFLAGELPLINVIWRWTRLLGRPGLALGGALKDAPPTGERRFPRTRLWLFSGCRSEQQFKAYASESRLPFQFHFAAYDRPLGAILRATALRDAIGAERGLVADDTLLRALES